MECAKSHYFAVIMRQNPFINLLHVNRLFRIYYSTEIPGPSLISFLHWYDFKLSNCWLVLWITLLRFNICILQRKVSKYHGISYHGISYRQCNIFDIVIIRKLRVWNKWVYNFQLITSVCDMCYFLSWLNTYLSKSTWCFIHSYTYLFEIQMRSLSCIDNALCINFIIRL